MVKKIVEEKKKSSFRNKKEKDVIYPLLQECMQLEQETGWQELFNNMSRGVCPKGIIIQNGIITGSISKKNNVKYNFLEEKPEDIIINIKNLFSNLVNIQSDNTKRNKEYDTINEIYNDFINMEWKAIKKKAIKDLLIQNYVIYLKNSYNLTRIATRKGLDVINNALNVYKTHESKDVEYSEGRIHSIKDIFVENGNVVNKRLEKLEIVCEDDPEESEDNFENNSTSLKDMWSSYLNSVAKN